MPDLVEDQFHANVEYQYVRGLFQDRLACNSITEDACRKTHRENADANTDHDHPDLIREGDGCHDIINAKDQIHEFHGQHGRPKRLDPDGPDFTIFIAASACHIFEVIKSQVDEIGRADHFYP